MCTYTLVVLLSIFSTRSIFVLLIRSLNDNKLRSWHLNATHLYIVES